MAVTYTFDVFATVDGFGSYNADGDWGGYWGKEGPEFLKRRLDLYSEEQRMILGANTFREFMQFIGDIPEHDLDPVNARMRSMKTTVISSTLVEPFNWPDATVSEGNAIAIVSRLKEESPVPLRSHGSLTLNRALMSAGLVDSVHLTIFPVISGRTGDSPIFDGADDFDLELLESRTYDSHTQELIYRPTLHGSKAGS